MVRKGLVTLALSITELTMLQELAERAGVSAQVYLRRRIVRLHSELFDCDGMDELARLEGERLERKEGRKYARQG